MIETAVRAEAIVRGHFAASIAATRSFFGVQPLALAEACRRLADRFERGGTLFVAGVGAHASDAQHVSVEFVHPVIVGKRALPAVALTSDAGVLTGGAPGDLADGFVRQLATLARPEDICLGLAGPGDGGAVRAALRAARDKGMLTVFLGSRADSAADIQLPIDSDQPLLVQEVQETAYHVLWELVHVFFERRDASELFGYLTMGDAPQSADALAAQVVASTEDKAREICRLRDEMARRETPGIADAGREIAARLQAGARLLVFGNGGSATDAQDAAADCLAPPMAEWQPLPALALTNDVGVLTAIGNDVGFEHVFARQLAAFGRAGDVAIAFSTSGASPNVVAAVREARARGLFTLAFCAGREGPLVRDRLADRTIVVSGDYVPRIQECHATAWHALLTVVQSEVVR